MQFKNNHSQSRCLYVAKRKKDSFGLLCSLNLASLCVKEPKLYRDGGSIKERDESKTCDTVAFISVGKEPSCISHGGRAPLLASLWREKICGRRRCLCIKKQLIYERRLNTFDPNSSSGRVSGFTSCFQCTAVLGHSCIFSIDFGRLMKPSTFISAVAVLKDKHLIWVSAAWAQAETQTHWFPNAATAGDSACNLSSAWSANVDRVAECKGGGGFPPTLMTPV